MRLFEIDQAPLDVPTLAVSEIAKLHGVPKADIVQELHKGIQIELEHTSDKDVAREIALDHLKELPDYYTRLHTMEKGSD